MTIGEMIKDLRKKAGLTQNELGNKMNVSASHISQYECGQRNPSTNQLRKFAIALNVPFREFITCQIDAIKENSEKADPDIASQFTQSEFCEKLAHIGYRLEESDIGLILIDSKNVEHKITIEQILDIDNKCDVYLKFLLSEIK